LEKKIADKAMLALRKKGGWTVKNLDSPLSAAPGGEKGYILI